MATTEELQKLEEIITKKVASGFANWFYWILYNEDYYRFEHDDVDEELVNEAKFVLKHRTTFRLAYELSLGDGNDWTLTFEFPDSFKEKFVTIDGYYSSDGDSEFSNVYYSSPYIFREVRYRRK